MDGMGEGLRVGNTDFTELMNLEKGDFRWTAGGEGNDALLRRPPEGMGRKTELTCGEGMSTGAEEGKGGPERLGVRS